MVSFQINKIHWKDLFIDKLKKQNQKHKSLISLGQSGVEMSGFTIKWNDI